MIKRISISVAVLLSTILVFSATAAQDPTPEEQAVNATTTRQAVFKLLGYNMGMIGDMARGRIEFDTAIAERNAKRIAALAPMIPELLAAMDTREFDVVTEALPVIWDKMGEVEMKAQNLVEAANTFAALAAGGDQRATMGGVRALGGACGSCHDEFRVDND